MASRQYQIAPVSGGYLEQNWNADFERIATLLESDSGLDMYCYIVRSIERMDGRMVQTGSGPNIEGDRITICTCKHFMRSFRSPEDWIGVWVTGLARKGVHDRRPAFYMMKVQAAFESHRDLVDSGKLPQGVIHTKSANRNRLGDVFLPRRSGDNEFDPDAYVPPIEDHSHAKSYGWHNDISYRHFRTGRRAALLVGDPLCSFVWDIPKVFPRFVLGRGQKKIAVEQFKKYFYGD